MIHSGMACIMPFKGIHKPTLGIRSAQSSVSAETRAVVVVLTLLLVSHPILYTYMYWREKFRTLEGHLRLTDRMAYCHDYLILRRSGSMVPELAPNAGRLPSLLRHDRRGKNGRRSTVITSRYFFYYSTLFAQNLVPLRVQKLRMTSTSWEEAITVVIL